MTQVEPRVATTTKLWLVNAIDHWVEKQSKLLHTRLEVTHLCLGLLRKKVAMCQRGGGRFRDRLVTKRRWAGKFDHPIGA